MFHIPVRLGLMLLIAIVATCAGVQAQEVVIPIAEPKVGIDDVDHIIVVHLTESQRNIDLSDKNVMIQSGNTTIEVSGDHQYLNYDQVYNGLVGNVEYDLYFTRLPIIQIAPTQEIVDEPKVLARLTYADAEQNYSSFCGIEIRGGFSQTFPKKTYDLELWKEDSGDETDSEKFGALRKDDDWVLDALYNEPLRIRSNIAHKLWLDIHQPYYQSEEENAKAGADVMFVEVFVDGRYNGLYNLSEQIDRKQLQLKDYNGSIRGELYKAEDHDNTRWNGVRSYDNSSEMWMGYEVKVPDPDNFINWSNFYDAIDAVANGDDAAFASTIALTVNIENAIDYFIYLNVLRALDNTGKNIFVARYDKDEPYFMVPWDLDAVMGIDWMGLDDSWVKGILSNKLFDRLLQLDPDNYRSQLRLRYEILRSNLLSKEALEQKINERFDRLTSELIYERESIVYGNYDFSADDRDYLIDWLERRLIYVDDYFRTLTSTDDTLSSTLHLWPNPANNLLNFSDPTLVEKQYTIYTMSGQRLQTGKIGFDLVVNVDELEPRVYVIHVDDRAASFSIAK